MKKLHQKAFTIIELLITIVVIGVLATLVLNVIRGAQDRAQATQAADELEKFAKAVTAYWADNGEYPPDHVGYWDPAINPLLVDPGAPNWNGPYIDEQFQDNVWGGGIGIWYYSATDEQSVYFDDDAPGTDAADNSGVVPQNLLLLIDEILDDGVLTTGKFTESTSVPGEAIYIIAENATP